MSGLIARPFIGTEKQTLHGFLDSQRDVLVSKLEGLSNDDVRRPVTPTHTNLLGLVKHCAAAEYRWFCIAFGRPCEQIPSPDEEEEEHLIRDTGESAEQILALYARARATCDQAIKELDLDTTGTAWTGDQVSMRWALTHMIEETARHAGHADIIRELVDCTVGYLPDDRQHIACKPYTLRIPLSSGGEASHTKR
jgi:uncharacterized damage-inducible protein DinB